MSDLDPCGVCGKETTDYQTLYDEDDAPTDFVVAVCHEHRVKIVGSRDPFDNVEPCVDENGEPTYGFAFEIVPLDE